MENLLALVISYFLGSIPTAYIVGKTLKGIDVTEMGSKNVGGANLWLTVSKKASVLVILADAAKAVLAVMLAKALALGLPFQIGCGLLVTVGHNWSPFLRFKGGRGMACAGGIALILTPWQFLIVLPVVLLGFILKNLSLTTIIGVLSLPLFTWVMTQNPTLTLGIAGIPLLMTVKRITANWEPFTPGEPVYSVILYRIMLDRDIPDREAWIKRNLADNPGGKNPA